MDKNLSLLLVAVAATGGGILSAYLGFAESKEHFNFKKFAKSLIISLLAGVSFAVGYSLSDGVGFKDLGLSFLSGAGADAILNRAGLGRLGKKKKP